MKATTTEEKLALVHQVGEEIVGEDELPALFESGDQLIAYDGFEPSGQMHIAQGILRAINVNKMIDAGFKFKMLVADWHGYLNNKMGGDLEKIKKVGEYFVEIWRASGMDLENVEFVWASDLVKSDGYWEMVMRIAKTTSLNRILRTTQIMGRSETDNLSAAQIIYPAMQAADIFMLGAHVTQLGMDQRKVNMLAREVANELELWKPIVVSNHMLLGLQTPSDTGELSAVDRAIELKMSKSKPDTAIFMTDTREDIERKINKAWAPEKETSENPLLEYCKYILFERFDAIEIQRPEKFGGNVTYTSYADLEADYASGALFPLDLKNSMIGYLDQLLQPVRDHFENDSHAKQLLEEVKSFEVTR